MANVQLKNVGKVYHGGVVAVEDFSLTIADKEFVVLVGPSGCGKSTTLRMIAGLEDISSGELLIDGARVNDVAPKDRDIAMVFQNYALYPHMTVAENMAFSLKLKKEEKTHIDEKVQSAANILGISELLDRKPKALSGGQRQRVAIGRAIVRDPQVFLMDEPLSNLDAKLRTKMRAELIKIRRRVNTTFIYVTHDQMEAMTLGDRIVVMKDGFIQQVGTPKEVFHHPLNKFVAGFIGTPQMNFFKATLMLDSEQYVIKLGGTRVVLSAAHQAALKARGTPPGDIDVGIRPEHIRLEKDGAPHAVTARVEVTELMGSEAYVHVALFDQSAIIRLPFFDAYHADIPDVGDDIFVSLPAQSLHLFDAATGANLLSL